MSSQDRDTEVLICGGGPIGLALAIELGRHGIECVVVEQATTPSTDPKAKFVNLRTMELLRRWGIADEVRSAAPIPADFPSDVVYADRLTGQEVVRLVDAFSTAPGRKALYPEPAQRIPQPMFQEVLRRHVQSLPTVTLRSGVRLETFRQTDSGVQAEIVDTVSGERQTIVASYLAGCDGARSTVRKQLGIEMRGEAGVAQSLGAIVRAPALWSLVSLGQAVHYWVLNDDLPVAMAIGPLDTTELWFFQLMGLPDGVDPSQIDPRKIMNACVGREIDCEIVDVVPWQIHNMLAERYRQGRAFVLGDAAHLHSPTGGFGMNTGIGDSVDLGWKLSAVLQGWGDEALLDTFEIERRPVHELVIEQSANNLAAQSILRLGPENGSETGEGKRRALGDEIIRAKTEHYRSIGLQLGYRYDTSPLNAPEATPAPAIDVVHYVPTARPGSRAPHAWLATGESLFDLFGSGFTLLHLREEDMDLSPIVNAARIRSLPLKVVRAADPTVRDLYHAALVLIRPDQHVAWRSDMMPEDPLRILDRARGVFVDVPTRCDVRRHPERPAQPHVVELR